MEIKNQIIKWAERWKRSRPEPKILQIELRFKPARIGLITNNCLSKIRFTYLLALALKMIRYVHYFIIYFRSFVSQNWRCTSHSKALLFAFFRLLTTAMPVRDYPLIEGKKFLKTKHLLTSSSNVLHQVNFPVNNLNFHWRWRWWDQIQATF